MKDNDVELLLRNILQRVNNSKGRKVTISKFEETAILAAIGRFKSPKEKL